MLTNTVSTNKQTAATGNRDGLKFFSTTPLLLRKGSSNDLIPLHGSPV